MLKFFFYINPTSQQAQIQIEYIQDYIKTISGRVWWW